MCLLHMKVGEMVSIDAINVDSELKKRLNALGFIRDTPLCIKRFGLFKSTVQVMINRSFIALRKSEASLIEVHKI
ncbi:MAG: FeoA domain-containing protein [Sulfurimonas sp.]|nr:FeoA domain-containing protein [Sulfurimonas sp.]